jgi:uncharacterized membrane protein
MSKKEDNEKSNENKKLEKKTSLSKEKLPYFLDFSLSIVQLVVVLMGGITTGLSLYAGASLIIAIERGCVAMISIGLVGWLTNWILSHNGINATYRSLLNSRDAADNNEKSHTMEYKA